MSGDFMTQLLQSAGSILEVNFDPIAAVFGLAFAALLGALIAQVYKTTNGKEHDRDVTMQSFVLLAIAIAGSMMIVGNNLARAFGLVGAVSIIRFRTAVQSTRQMAFLFISIVVGMACGLGFYFLGLIFAIAASACIFILWFTGFGHIGNRPRKYRLLIKWTSDYDVRKDLEGVFQELAVLWHFESIEIKQNNRILTYDLVVPFGVDAFDLAFRLRTAVQMESANLTVSLAPGAGNLD